MAKETKIVTQFVIEEIIDLADFISDKQRTLDSWLGKLKNSIVSPEEIVCRFF